MRFFEETLPPKLDWLGLEPMPVRLLKRLWDYFSMPP